MVASIGAIAAPSQGVSYYERDGYYAKDDPDHRAASAWTGKGADALGLSGPVDPDVFTAILEGRVPDGPQLGRPGKDGEIVHRPGRDLTLSAPKSVSLAALVGGDARVAEAHGRAVERSRADARAFSSAAPSFFRTATSNSRPASAVWAASRRTSMSASSSSTASPA